MQNSDPNNFKHVFVCGLPRSGTSVLGRNVARLENCTGFKNTGVLEDEGQFLQNVYASDHERGGAGSFGFHPDSHLTEASDLLTLQNAARLRNCWEPYWDASKSIRVEKTPGNLLMTRFLQVVFPNSYFVVLRRHPVAVSMATQKWKDSVQSLNRLFQHWLHCHDLFEEDKKHLKHVYELTYEDYIEDPHRYHQEIAAFIGTRVRQFAKEDTFRRVVEWRNPAGRRVPENGMEETSAAHNQKYFDRWCQLLTHSVFRSYYRYLAEKYEPKFANYGYSLVKGLAIGIDQARANGTVSVVLGPLFCVGAGTGALLRRLFARSKEWLRIKSKAVLPEFIIAGIRHARSRQSVRKRTGKIVSSQV